MPFGRDGSQIMYLDGGDPGRFLAGIFTSFAARPFLLLYRESTHFYNTLGCAYLNGQRLI